MIIWDNEFKVGLPAIDSEHLILFSLLNQIDLNIEEENGAECLDDVIGAVLKYVDFHFNHEEQLMFDTLYPKWDEHCRQHRAFSEKIHDMRHDAMFEKNGTVASGQLRKYILDWFIGHILSVDQEFSLWLTNRTAAGGQLKCIETAGIV